MISSPLLGKNKILLLLEFINLPSLNDFIRGKRNTNTYSNQKSNKLYNRSLENSNPLIGLNKKQFWIRVMNSGKIPQLSSLKNFIK